MSASSEAVSTQPTSSLSAQALIESIERELTKTNIPEFRSGDTLRVHVKIVEGQKERIQVFEGVVIRRNKGNLATATFTVRKISYNIGVERTFLLHSPRIDKIEVVNQGQVRRSRLFYLRGLRGKSARIRSRLEAAGLALVAPVESMPTTEDTASIDTEAQASPDSEGAIESQPKADSKSGKAKKKAAKKAEK